MHDYDLATAVDAVRRLARGRGATKLKLLSLDEGQLRALHVSSSDELVLWMRLIFKRSAIVGDLEAIEYALNLEGAFEQKLEDRRRFVERASGCSFRTVIRREVSQTEVLVRHLWFIASL